jgi:predicted permease
MMFAIVVVGYAVSKLGYISRQGFLSINSFLIHIALPCMIIASVASLDPSTGAVQVPWFFAMSFAMYLLIFGVTWLLNRALNVPQGQRPVYLFSGLCNNTGLLCLPILAAIYGSQTILGSSIYVLMCNLVIGTLGLAVLESGDPTLHRVGENGFRLRFNVKTLWNAPLVACVFALILFFTGLRLPGLVETTIDTLGSTCVPLAMVMVGCALAQSDLKSVFTDARIYLYAFVRNLALPAVCYLVLHAFIADSTLLWVFVIMCAAPVGVMVPAWAGEYHQDESFAARLTVITTLLSFVFIPLLVTLMGVV